MGHKIVHGLRKFFSVYCFIGAVVYVSILLTEPSETYTNTVILVFAGVFALLGFLLWPKKRKSTIAPQSHASPFTVEIKSGPVPDHVGRDMRGTYSATQAENSRRIVGDCLQLMETTESLDTFFKRFTLGMQHAFTLEQAKTTGINTGAKDDYTQTLLDMREKHTDGVLQKSYEKMKREADQLKTDSGKRNRYAKYLELLEEHAHEYALDNGDLFDKIKSEVATKST